MGNLPFFKTYWRKFTRKPAQGTLEFALASGLFFFLVFGIIEFGYLLFVFSTVFSSAREAARFGSSVTNEKNCSAIAAAAVRVGGMAGVSTSNVDIRYDNGPTDTRPFASLPSCASNPTTALGDRVVVRVVVPYQSLTGVLPSMSVTNSDARTIIKSVDIAGNFPTPPLITFTPTITLTPTLTLIPSLTPTLTPTLTLTPTIPGVPSDTPTITLTPTNTATVTNTPTPTVIPSFTPTNTAVSLNPTPTPTITPTSTITPPPTRTPTPTEITNLCDITVTKFTDVKKSDTVSFTLTRNAGVITSYYFRKITLTWTLGTSLNDINFPPYNGSNLDVSSFIKTWAATTYDMGNNLNVALKFSTDNNGKAQNVTQLVYTMQAGSDPNALCLIKVVP